MTYNSGWRKGYTHFFLIFATFYIYPLDIHGLRSHIRHHKRAAQLTLTTSHGYAIIAPLESGRGCHGWQSRQPPLLRLDTTRIQDFRFPPRPLQLNKLFYRRLKMLPKVPLYLWGSRSERINRKVFWLGALIRLAIVLVVGLVSIVTKEPVFIILIMIPMFCMGTIMNIKRWHDLDRSGWWWFISAVPLGVFYDIYKTGFCTGTDGKNKYGPPIAQTKSTTA